MTPPTACPGAPETRMILPYWMRTPQGAPYEMPAHWNTDDWPPFGHYNEIGYMMPVQSPSVGLFGVWEEFEAQYNDERGSLC